MKKEEIRKEFFKLRIKHHSYSQCKKILLAKFGIEISKRTLQRWNKRLNETEWNLKDKSTKPKIIYYKITQEIEKQVILIKKQTGWGAEKIEDVIDIGHTTINKILNKYKLTNPNPNRKKRIKYIRW